MENKPKILYVDDEPINLRTFKAAFTNDFEVLTAESGEDGLALFANHVDKGLAIVISDQRMPEMSGVDFLVNALEIDPTPTRIILTAYADFQNVSEAVNKGQIFQFVQKPWFYNTFRPILLRAFEVYSMKIRNQQLITDLEESNRKLLASNAQLEEELLNRKKEEKRRQEAEIMMLSQAKLASLGEMATGIAHEINQPLSYISVILQVARRDYDSGNFDSEEFMKEVDESLKQVGRISTIIDHLRSFGRIDTVGLTSVDLQSVVEDSLIPLRQRLKLSNIDLSTDITPDLRPILGIATQLEQVMINLLMNAIDALETCSDKKLVIRLYSDGDENIIEVEDNGIGVSSQLKDKIFEPFFTTKEVGKGTGVGLAIVYGLVKDHKGTITCHSNENEGCLFKISLPVTKSQ